MKQYAIINGNRYTGLQSMLTEFNPPAVCIFNPPIKEEMVDRAPYLVDITNRAPVKNWLVQHQAPWGLYFFTESSISLIALRKHLRKYTYALIPDEVTPVQFRFYDPRVFWDIIRVIDDRALHALLGPIDIVASSYQGILIQDSFKVRRAPFPTPLRMKGSYFTLDEKQYKHYEQLTQQSYIDELSRHMMNLVGPQLIEKAQNSAEKIHQRMLEHERDVKGATITHPVDQAFLLNQSAKAEERSEQKGQNEQKGIRLEALIAQTAQPQESSDPSNLQQAHYHFSRQTEQWTLVRGAHKEQVNYLISRALSQIGKTPMSQNLFHEQTNFEYIAAERADYERKDQLRKAEAQKVVAIPSHLKNYHEHPYFLKQGDEWYFIDKEGYAALIDDERRFILKKIHEHEYRHQVLEDYFNDHTHNRYASRTATTPPPLQERAKEDEPYMPETMDELRAAIDQLAHDLYYFCREEEVTHSDLIEGLGYLLIKNDIFRFDDIPQTWLNDLYKDEDSGEYRVRMLFHHVLGYIPDQLHF